MGVGDGPDAVPVGRVADQVREQQRAGVGTDHALERIDVGVVRVGLHVDEHRDEAGADERRDVGREGEHRGHHLRPGRQVEQLHREVQRRGPGVDRDAVALAEERGDRRLERCDPPTDAERGRTRPQHLDARLDLGVVVHAARVEDPLVHGPLL